MRSWSSTSSARPGLQRTARSPRSSGSKTGAEPNTRSRCDAPKTDLSTIWSSPAMHEETTHDRSPGSDHARTAGQGVGSELEGTGRARIREEVVQRAAARRQQSREARCGRRAFSWSLTFGRDEEDDDI